MLQRTVTEDNPVPVLAAATAWMGCNAFRPCGLKIQSRWLRACREGKALQGGGGIQPFNEINALLRAAFLFFQRMT